MCLLRLAGDLVGRIIAKRLEGILISQEEIDELVKEAREAYGL